jgi:hypothetical protein
VNITVASTAHWLCVNDAPGGKIANYAQYRQGNHLQYHFLSSNPSHRTSAPLHTLIRDSLLSGVEWECPIPVLPHCSNVLSADVKSVTVKCWLYTYCVCSFLVCSALQGFPSLCAHSRALCNNEITNYRNETVIHVVFVRGLLPLSAALVIQHVGQNYF